MIISKWNPPVRSGGDRGDSGIAIEAEERHRGRQDTRAFVLGLVEHLARGRGDDRMHQWRLIRAQVIGRHHRAKRGDERAVGVGQEGCDPGERLLLLCVEDMEDGAHEQRMARLLPVATALERPFGIDQDIGDVLHVADFLVAAANLEQRVVAR